MFYIYLLLNKPINSTLVSLAMSLFKPVTCLDWII